MQSFLLLLTLLPLIATSTAPLTSHQHTQVTTLLSLFREVNSTFTDILQDEDHFNVCKEFNLTKALDDAMIFLTRVQEIDWEALQSLPITPTATQTVPELIEEANYTVTSHEIDTKDGYVLTAHRIQHGKTSCPEEPKRVVFLQHGLLGDSSNWIITGSNQRGLAYILADACFDVWMGNYRGNTHSRQHRDLDLDVEEDLKKFYTFNIHDLGTKDLAASIDFVLNETKAEKLSYVGHSMGTTGMFILLAEEPEYNAKIEMFGALAPVAGIKNMRSFIRPVACTKLRIPFVNWLNDKKVYEILPQLPQTITFICKVPLLLDICTTVMYLAGGWSPEQMDYFHLGAIVEHSPAGTSQGTLLHYAQSYESETFAQFDYGETENMERYGQPTPPEYDLSKVNVPVGLFWSDNDLLADRRDVANLRRELGSNVALDYRVHDNLFNHLDYIFGLQQTPLVYKQLLEFLQQKEEVDAPPSSSSPLRLLASLLLAPLFLLPLN